MLIKHNKSNLIIELVLLTNLLIIALLLLISISVLIIKTNCVSDVEKETENTFVFKSANSRIRDILKGINHHIYMMANMCVECLSNRI